MSFTRDAFFTLIIERCKKRIQNYRKRLSSCVGSMRSQLAKHSRIDEALRALLTIHDHKEFASQAYRFRKMAACKDLDDLADQQAVYSSWSDLRHLIGRCGSWYRAADFLVRHSPDFRDILQRCSIHGLSNISDYPAFNIEQNIRVLLEQVCSLPRPETDNAVRVLSTASGTREALAKVQKPFVHAEAAVAKHFSTQDFAFVGSDRYIGCSKPPCYCCQLYMKQSHINMGHKETSGRAWLKWALPNDDREGNEATGTYKLDDSKILSDMIDTMKSDVTRSLTHGQYGRKRKHDTTTGITPMIWEDSAQPESVRPSPAPALLQGKSA
ncbi:hypothetical protein DOTSEDRAFT_158281 [Dothistroma septosporum NZE10]|uniref:Uncharacterized protein n=1 Tax=Dothistroma septosporum (strain NZE10 / CBS 128990) TaxID=675120 RepID=N1PCM2_DOTSN|nr:hypothetical protein DOTSEDRAFT_158281 [Dothistroma septosporum NZE10]